MSLPESLGSIYESIARVWGVRFLAAAQRGPTAKHLLCGYVSTVDRFIVVTEALLQAMIDEAEVTAGDIDAARTAPPPPASQANTRKDIVLTLLWSLEHRGGRISIAPGDLLDWLDALFQRFGQDERLGGAPGSMIHTLIHLCHEPNAVIFTVFHSEKQASVYDPGIRMLTADLPNALGTVDARTYHQVRADRPDDPNVRNYPFEYFSQASLAWEPDPAGHLTVTHGPDRLICTAPYLRYAPNGHVRAGDTPAIIERFFQFPGLTGAQRDACAAAVALNYPYMVLTGLQGAAESQHPAIERDLVMLLDKVTIHVELSGARNLPWMHTLIRRCVSSVGVNDDELPEICSKVVGKTTAVNGRYDSIWALFHDARALASAFDLPRLYVHTHVADLVLRRLPVDDRSLTDEILADLFAKKIVVDWLWPQLPADRRLDSKLNREGLEALTTFMSQVAGLAGKTLLQWLADTAQFARIGHFRIDDDYAVAVIPVAWFYGDLPQAIITTGAGDRSSVVSFVQSCFTQPRSASID